MKLCTALLSLAAALAFAPALYGQALPTATKTGTIQAGAEIMDLNTDYTPDHTQGIGGYVDYDFIKFFHVYVGAEAEARFGGIRATQDVGEDTYLIGPRFSYHTHDFNVYGKVLFGRGLIINQDTGGSSGYGVSALGGGLEYRIKGRYNVRIIDFEQQRWPDFPPNGLTPLAISVGIAYIIR